MWHSLQQSRETTVPSSPTRKVCLVCSITLLATEIALLISFKQPTAPTLWVSLQQHWSGKVCDHHVTDHVTDHVHSTSTEFLLNWQSFGPGNFGSSDQIFAGPKCPLQDSNVIEDVWKEKKCLPIHDHCIKSCLPFLIRTNGEMTHVKPHNNPSRPV